MKVMLNGMWREAAPSEPFVNSRTEFFKCEVEVWALPSIGDTLMLGDQDVKVTERVFYPDRVELWIGEFAGWDRDSVAALFEETHVESST